MTAYFNRGHYKFSDGLRYLVIVEEIIERGCVPLGAQTLKLLGSPRRPAKELEGL